MVRKPAIPIGGARGALALAVLLSPIAASADAVVTLCGADNQPVAGMDFRRAMAAGGHITFACPAGAVISLSAMYAVTAPTWIDGAGNITLDAGNAVAMFWMTNPSTVLTLTGLKLRRGHSTLNPFPLPNPGGNGGIVSGKGTIEISASSIEDTSNPVFFTEGAARVTDAEFSGGAGTAISAPSIDVKRIKIHGAGVKPFQNSGGTVSIADSSIDAGGSSFFDNCRLTITGSRFSFSLATPVISGCDTTISSSRFSSNHGATGGALYLLKNAAGLKIAGGSFTNNVADSAGGAIALEPSTAANRPISLANVTFEGNRAVNGGAIDLGEAIENSAVLAGKALIFSNNVASAGGGAIAGQNAQVSLSRVLFVGNTSASGGAIRVQAFAPRTNVIANTIFTRNSSPQGSVFYGSGVRFINVTIAGNQGGPAIYPFWPAANVNSPEPWRLISFRNVALANNSPSACDNNVWQKLFQDSGSNLQFPAAGCPATISVADPGFDSMFTPAWGGPANGKGDLTACTALPVGGVDLYGRHRPQGKGCSIGAVEGDIEDLVLQRNPKYGNAPKSPPVGSGCQCATTTPPTTSPPPAGPSLTTLPPPAPPDSTTTTQPPTGGSTGPFD